jgi:hypothetical protein
MADAQLDITDDWPTKKQIADRAGKSIQWVLRQTKAGKLHPRVDEHGENRYPPDEVATIFNEKRNRAAEFAEFELDTVRSVIDLVREPRERIDQLFFKLLDRQQIQIEKLEDKLESNRLVVEEAKDNTADREVAKTVVETEAKVKAIAAQRFIETISKLLTRGSENNGGVKFTTEQLEELMLTEDFLTAEQKEAAKKAIDSKRAVKKVIEGTAEVVKKAPEVTSGA